MDFESFEHCKHTRISLPKRAKANQRRRKERASKRGENHGVGAREEEAEEEGGWELREEA